MEKNQASINVQVVEGIEVQPNCCQKYFYQLIGATVVAGVGIALTITFAVILNGGSEPTAENSDNNENNDSNVYASYNLYACNRKLDFSLHSEIQSQPVLCVMSDTHRNWNISYKNMGNIRDSYFAELGVKLYDVVSSVNLLVNAGSSAESRGCIVMQNINITNCAGEHQRMCDFVTENKMHFNESLFNSSVIKIYGNSDIVNYLEFNDDTNIFEANINARAFPTSCVQQDICVAGLLLNSIAQLICD